MNSQQLTFVYRAIMEWSQFGDTEMTCEKIKEHWMNMAQEKDKLKNEFARLANVVDDRKVKTKNPKISFFSPFRP